MWELYAFPSNGYGGRQLNFFPADMEPPSGFNVGYFNNASVNNLLSEVASNITASIPDLQMAQQLIVQQAPWIFLVNEDQLIGTSSTITGLQIWAANTLYFNNIAVSSSLESNPRSYTTDRVT